MFSWKWKQWKIKCEEVLIYIDILYKQGEFLLVTKNEKAVSVRKSKEFELRSSLSGIHLCNREKVFQVEIKLVWFVSANTSRHKRRRQYCGCLRRILCEDGTTKEWAHQRGSCNKSSLLTMTRTSAGRFSHKRSSI